MSVSTLVNRQDPCACDGETILFELTLPYFLEETITATLRHKTTYVETELTLNSDFEIPGEEDEDYGNIRLIGDYAASPPSSSYELHIIRILPLSQLTTFAALSSIAAGTTLNTKCDQLIMIAQQLQDQLNRAAIAPTTSGQAGITLPLYAGKYIRGNSEGDDLEAADLFADLDNPMTVAADLIVGGTGGIPTRLSKGSSLQHLRMNLAGTAHEYVDPLIVNVKDHGAAGDGVTDDTTAIQAVINTNPAGIFFPAGTYIVSGLTFLYANREMVIEGEGEKSIIKLKAASSSPVLDFNYVDGVTIHDLVIDGNMANQTEASHGIDLYDSPDLKIYNVYVHDTRYNGIHINATDGFTIDRCRLKDIGKSGVDTNLYGMGVKVIGSKNFRITNNTFKSVRGTGGVQVAYTTPYTPSNFIISNNYFYDQLTTQASAINVYAGNDGIIGFNSFYDFPDTAEGTNAIYTKADRVMIIGNVAEDISGMLIELNEADGCLVIGNACRQTGSGSWTRGIYNAGADNVIIGNRIENGTHHGILVTKGGDRCIIEGNIVKNSQDGAAVYLYTTGGEINTVHIKNNFLYDDQGEATQTYGIQVDGTGSISNIVAEGNYISGNKMGATDGLTIPTFTDEDATPSVKEGNMFKTGNTQATTITMFDDGVPQQRIVVIINDANTTIDFTGTHLKGNGGADWSPGAGDWMECFCDGTDWYCSVHDCTA